MSLPLTPHALVRPERAKDAARIDALLDACFGQDRFNKTAYRFREGVDPVRELSYVVEYVGADGPSRSDVTSGLNVAATIRYWPVLLPDDTPALLLGPIAVDPLRQSEGIGANLMSFTMDQARALGYGAILLVGDAPYYNRFGFTREVTLGLELPGWVDVSRFLGLEYVPGILSRQKGMVKKWPPTRLLPHYQDHLPKGEERR